MTIEDIILDRDRRGISALRPHLPEDFCGQAASLVLEHPGTAMIVTGFYILAAGAAETDGPPGAIAMGDALQSLGYEVVYVTDRYAAPLMTAAAGSRARVVDFPIADAEASKEFSRDLLSQVAPSVLISIERCGLDQEGLYRNMHGQDISRYNASVDYLFLDHPSTVGIGDGGNEIGMGNLASIIPTVPTLVKAPCVTTTTRLVISSVSNWGGYGLVAALSIQTGRDLLPSVEAEQELVRRIVDLGAVDGMSTRPEYRVDGFSLEENSQTVVRLHELLAEEGVSP
jgi:hypothetical protein